jgi:hypothetical protein
MIGDSVMLGARAELERTIPGARVDAGVSRRLDAAVPIVDAARESRSLPSTVVIDLGTNGGDFDGVVSTVARIMQHVGPQSTVYFVTVHAPRRWISDVNAALYSAVPQFPNAHVLDWHGFALEKWFASDDIHLAGDGPAQFAQFVRDGIRSEPTTYADPFAGVAVPSSGFYVTDDPKWGKDQGPSSFAVRLFDGDGTQRAELPRAVVDNDALNVERHTLVVTDDGIRVEATPLESGAGLPGGCTQTEHVAVLAVALCGRPGGPNQLLGDRILVNPGSGWRQLVARPAGAVVGHWNWASPSPDGQWVLASWSAECEVVTSLFIRVSDGATHAVTGEPGIAAPESGDLGWSPSGDALAVFGNVDTGCGAPAARPRGVYVVSPTVGIRRMLLPLGPNTGALRWTSVDDRRSRAPDAVRRRAFRSRTGSNVGDVQRRVATKTGMTRVVASWYTA